MEGERGWVDGDEKVGAGWKKAREGREWERLKWSNCRVAG